MKLFSLASPALALATTLTACAVDPTTTSDDQALSAPPSLQICSDAAFHLTIAGQSFASSAQIDLNLPWAFWTSGGTNITTTQSDVCGNFGGLTGDIPPGALQPTVYDHGLLQPFVFDYPTTGTCRYTNGYTDQTWSVSFPAGCGGGSTGGGTPRGHTVHLFM